MVLATALLCLVAGAGLVSGIVLRRLSGAMPDSRWCWVSWAASGSLPFPVSNQSLAPSLRDPLVLGSLAGVIGERAVWSSSRRFLNAAFAAAVVTR